MSFSLAFTVGADISNAIKNIADLQKKTSQGVGQISDSFKTLQTVAVGALGVLSVGKLASAFDSAVTRAAEFQNDINQLRTALDATGQATDRAIAGFVNYASQIQKTTKFSDSAVVSTASLIQSISNLSGQQLQRATKATLDLSTALGVDLEGTARDLGKVLNGDVGELKKFGVILQAGKTQAETFEIVLSALEKRFGGAAEKSVQTYAGSIAQVQNNFAAAVKTFGQVIIENDAVIQGINALSAAFTKAAGVISENSGLISNFVSGSLSALNIGLKLAVPAVVALTAGFVAYNAITLVSTASQVGFSFALQYSLVTLNGLTAGVLRNTAALLANPIVAGAVAVGAIAAFATRVAIIRDDFVSLGDAVKAAGLEIARFFTFGQTAEEFGRQIDELKQKKIQVNAVDAFDTFNQLNSEAKKFRQNLQDVQVARLNDQRKTREQAILENDKTIDSLRTTLKDAGKTQLEIVKSNYDEQLKAIDQGLKLQTISIQEANDLRQKSTAKYQSEARKIEEGLTNSYREEADKRAAAEKKVADEAIRARSEIGGLVQGIVGNVSQGAAGAANAIAGIAGAIVDAYIPGLGQAVSEFIQLLSTGPETAKQFVLEFVNAVPGIVQNILLAIPAIVQALQANTPELIRTFIRMIPIVVNGFIDQLPALIESMANEIPLIIIALIEEIPRLIGALIAAMPRVIGAFVSGLTNAMPSIGISMATHFGQAFVKQVPAIVSSIADGVKNAIQNIGGGVGDAAGGLFGGIGSAIGGVGKIFGFADGGVVKGGMPFKDSVPILAQRDEEVLSRSDRVDLAELRDEVRALRAQGERTIVHDVTLKFGLEQFARLQFETSRRGFRVVGV